MILVTGATGLVGSHLLVKLIKEKHQVRALYRTESKKEQARKVFSYYFEDQEKNLFDTIEWFQASIDDVPALSEAFNDIDYVYHCAAMISFNPAHYKKLRKVNIEGTANIVNLCLIHNVKKLCHVSSIAAIGKDLTQPSIDETTEWNPEIPNSVYAITKYGAEMEVWRGTQEGLNAVIVNPGIIIGPGFFSSGSGFLFKKIYSGMKYYTTGTTGYVSIDDVINIMYTLTTGTYSNKNYILIGENLSYKTAFTTIAEALNKPKPTKKATPFLLKVAYYLQLWSHFFFRTKRSVFRSSIQSAFANNYYKNDKIKKELTYSFIPIKKAIKETATVFLKEV
ncbi:NAD-dependent epimerase/dehydratase family protein [Aquimarina sp. 2201CG5-10]|uniref:NAD-dependent epimerase/dehydratase family protein n=1 Tax=Aquimarina callyspongiae TaxID=3098150 RepID=UPI002AB4C3EB|nr:NAD-dependent epimerase/dehydratase family protein [Aquimarina sp. 2201CG5-10]MDY8134983.1 NAD-dependent epimerase/dehydratase family protein [Aquimarina sp. 2201CG5-10]